MSDALDLDRIRDAAAGRLSPEQQAVLVARRGAEPDLDAMARDFEAVAAMGDADDAGAVPACTVSFDRLALDDATAAPARPAFVRWAPFLAAAAAVLVVFGAVLVTRRDVAEAGPVILQAIVLDEVAAPAPLPAAALDYAPTNEKGLRFVEGVADGKALAAASGRPLVVFVYHPQCPFCVGLERTTFRDVTVAPTATQFVLARANVANPKDHVDSLMKGVSDVGWPVFLVFHPDGTRFDAFAGSDGATIKDAAALVAALARDVTPAASPLSDSAASWDAVHRVARALADADATAVPAERWSRLTDAAAAAQGTPLEARVAATKAATFNEARQAIATARALAEGGNAVEASKTLDEAASRLRGTPHEEDLRRVRARLVADGRFPTLETAR
jgi:hypothetical protein